MFPQLALLLPLGHKKTMGSLGYSIALKLKVMPTTVLLASQKILTFLCCCDQKSVNLQYITLDCLDDGTNESLTKSLKFQVLFFFILFIDLGHSKLFIFIFIIL